MNLSNAIAVMLAIVLPMSALAGEPLERGQKIELSASQRAEIEATIRDALKDPDSAKFSGLAAAINAKGVVTACGYVNAKNSFGGYAGKEPFIGVILTSDKFFPIGFAKNPPELTMKLCSDSGVF